MEQLIVEVDSKIREIERFFTCLDKAAPHVYGLIKTAILEVRERLECHYQLIKYIWTTENTRSDVIKAALNSLANNKLTKGEVIHYLASIELSQPADQFFKTFSKSIYLVENFRRLMRLRVIGGPAADNVEMYRQVDEILLAYG